MAANVLSQWDLIYMMGLVSACERTRAFVLCKKESDGMQIYLAATENWFVDPPTAAELGGGVYQVSAEPLGKHTFSQVGQ